MKPSPKSIRIGSKCQNNSYSLTNSRLLFNRFRLKAVNTNRYITRFYIFYQAIILCLSFISIAVTAMSLWEALDLALSDSLSTIYTGVIIILPIIFFVFVCFKYESNTQLFWAFIFRMVANCLVDLH